MKKKIVGILLLTILATLLGGCFNYEELNKVTFVTSMIIDEEDDGRVSVYLDCIKPYRDAGDSSDKGRRIIYKGVGKSVLEAIREVNMAASYKINLMQNRAIIFTEKAARSGIGKFIDLLTNNTEVGLKSHMFVLDGDIKKLMEVTSNDEEYLGVFLEELVSKNKYNPRAIIATLDDYLNGTSKKGKIALTGAIEVKQDVVDQKVTLKGGAVFRDNKMVEKIDVRDGLSYNILMDKVKTGNLEIPNPEERNTFITLDILENRTFSNVKYDGKKITLTKRVNTTAAVAESQGKLYLNSKMIRRLEKIEEKRIEKYLSDVIRKYYDKKIDVLDIQRLLEIEYPREKINIDYKDLEFNVIANINIEGTGISKDSILN